MFSTFIVILVICFLGAVKEKNDKIALKNRDTWERVMEHLSSLDCHPYSSQIVTTIDIATEVELVRESRQQKHNSCKLKVVEQVGRGKFAAVFQSRLEHDGRLTYVALKVAQFNVDSTLQSVDVVPPEAVSKEFMVCLSQLFFLCSIHM